MVRGIKGKDAIYLMSQSWRTLIFFPPRKYPISGNEIAAARNRLTASRVCRFTPPAKPNCEPVERINWRDYSLGIVEGTYGKSR